MRNYFKLIIYICLVFIINTITYSQSNVINPNLTHEYVDTPEKMFLKNQLFLTPVGGTIIFGRYEQDNNFENGPEPVEWIVLYNDTDNKTVMLISKYIIDCYRFNGFSENVTWETCTLRDFMNNDMMLNMFNNNELLLVKPTYLFNMKNLFNNSYSGEATVDFLFLPGIEEMLQYFSNENFVNEARINELLKPSTKRMCYGTDYAIARGLRVMGDDKKYPKTANYFLRTTGLNSHRIWFGDVYADYYQAFVSENGEIKPDGTGINSIDDGIRPMVQLKY